MNINKRKQVSQLFLKSKYLDENCIDEMSELYKCSSGITQLNLIAWGDSF